VPHQLPRGTGFVGREQELAALDGFMATEVTGARSSPVGVIEGPPGVGKTALAIHWAQRVSDRFPDGQIFIDLHGCAGRQRPLSGNDVLRFVLWSLGASPSAWSDDSAETAECYCTTVKGLRLLIVLDDVAEPEQIAPLLAGASSATVLATTRSGALLRKLHVLRPVRRVRLAPFTEHHSERMLARILGDARVEAEPRAVARIIELCGRMPQALSVAAEHAVGRPQLALSDLAVVLARAC
jgi:hypothetical protein